MWSVNAPSSLPQLPDKTDDAIDIAFRQCDTAHWKVRLPQKFEQPLSCIGLGIVGDALKVWCRQVRVSRFLKKAGDTMTLDAVLSNDTLRTGCVLRYCLSQVCELEHGGEYDRVNTLVHSLPILLPALTKKIDLPQPLPEPTR